MFSKRKDSGFPYGCADAAATDGRRGSNVYEVNQWLWHNQFQNPIENVALNSGPPHRLGLAFQL
jgi:hypothetical protein